MSQVTLLSHRAHCLHLQILKHLPSENASVPFHAVGITDLVLLPEKLREELISDRPWQSQTLSRSLTLQPVPAACPYSWLPQECTGRSRCPACCVGPQSPRNQDSPAAAGLLGFLGAAESCQISHYLGAYLSVPFSEFRVQVLSGQVSSDHQPTCCTQVV